MCFAGAQVTSQKTYKISVLKWPSWLSKSGINFKMCKYNQCTIDTSITNETDVVLVNGVELKDSFRSPQRWQHQLYVLAAWESPVHINSDFNRNPNSAWNKQINLTMTYRVDSDIFAPYSWLKFIPQPIDKRPDYYAIANATSKLAVWVVSHCNTQSKRERYVKLMQKYIEVDIFGSCGKPCSRKNCDLDISKYKFYLSFENSLCTDYITEKFFKLFSPRMHLIPVVRGGADYDKYFDNRTYINAAHFKTAKDLALHLKYLASDLETYSQYLEYKDLYRPVGGIDYFSCLTCQFIHMHPKLEPHNYNLKSWFTNGQCHNPNDF